MALNFPAAPAPEELYTVGTRTWQWDAVKGRWDMVPPAANTELADILLAVEQELPAITSVADAIAEISALADIAGSVSIAADNVDDITNFSDVYQGPKAAAPTTRNDTTALVEGDLYFNTVESSLYIYNGTAWQYITETDISAVITAAITAHEAAADPHPQYATDVGVAAAVAAGLTTVPDEVQQYADLANFPVSGSAGTLYIAADTGLVYRWDGSAYLTVVGGSGGSGGASKRQFNILYLKV